MTMLVDTINNTAQRLPCEGYNVAACTLRAWIHDGSLPASWSGKKALLYYPAVLARIKLGRAVTIDEVLEMEKKQEKEASKDGEHPKTGENV